MKKRSVRVTKFGICIHGKVYSSMALASHVGAIGAFDEEKLLFYPACGGEPVSVAL